MEELGIEVSLVRLTLIESILIRFSQFFYTIPFQVAWQKSSKVTKSVEI